MKVKKEKKREKYNKKKLNREKDQLKVFTSIKLQVEKQKLVQSEQKKKKKKK